MAQRTIWKGDSASGADVSVVIDDDGVLFIEDWDVVHSDAGSPSFKEQEAVAMAKAILRFYGVTRVPEKEG